MKKLKLQLKMDDLRVESFPTDSAGGVAAMSDYTHAPRPCTTHSLNYATHCDCSAGGPNCTLDCVEQSQATDIWFCCG